MDASMLFFLALLPALVSVLLFLGTVRLRPASRRSALEIVDSSPISAVTRPDPSALARAIGSVPIRDRDTLRPAA
jgi:hypothetical protein